MNMKDKDIGIRFIRANKPAKKIDDLTKAQQKTMAFGSDQGFATHVFLTKKYDGRWSEIHKNGDEVKFYTSNSAEFLLPRIADEIIEKYKGINFIAETEFVGDTKGKLGQRRHTGIMTTWVTRTNKGLHNDDTGFFKMFNLLAYEDEEGNHFSWRTSPAEVRFKAMEYMRNIGGTEHLEILKPLRMPYNEAVTHVNEHWLNKGWEGGVAVLPQHMHQPAKRSKTSIKIKGNNFLKVKVIGFKWGQNAFEDLVGSLEVQDADGLIFNVSSGLSMEEREIEYYEEHIEGHDVLIHYDAIMDTYVCPKLIKIL